MPRLIVIAPKFEESGCVLPDGTWAVGRGQQNHIVIQDNSVSVDHGELLVYGGEVIVRERGSRNGTFVNGGRVREQSGVNHGQRLRFGRVEFRLELDDPAPEEPSATHVMHRYARAEKQPEAIPTPYPSPPVRFAPPEPDAAHTSTGFHQPAPSPAPAAPAKPPGPGRPGRKWFWLPLAATAAAALWWLVFR